MSVDIEVTYRAPPDFNRFSPYYRPASSITLQCIAHGATDSVQYQWQSTSPQSFTHSQTHQSISRNLLTASDAGIHTCRITDIDGTMVSTSIRILLYGEG